MTELGKVLTEADLLSLVCIAAPQARDRGAVARAAREDPDILVAMLRDPRVVSHLLANTSHVVATSPRLFFAVLLVRIRAELDQSSYTIEQESRHLTLVFDSREVAALLHRPGMLAYLVAMLASFVRVRAQSVRIRLRRGTWSRLDWDDLDLPSLLAWEERALPDAHFGLERRIGDVCLFRSSFCPTAPAVPGARSADPVRARRELAEIGRQHYRRASGRREARELAMAETLEELAVRFDMAVKPLALLAGRYIDRLRARVFEL